MKIKIVLNFISVVIALIVGGALINLIDFQNLNINKPFLAIIYLMVLVFVIGSMIKRSKSK